jgi:hypothetical protein
LRKRISERREVDEAENRAELMDWGAAGERQGKRQREALGFQMHHAMKLVLEVD